MRYNLERVILLFFFTVIIVWYDNCRVFFDVFFWNFDFGIGWAGVFLMLCFIIFVEFWVSFVGMLSFVWFRFFCFFFSFLNENWVVIISYRWMHSNFYSTHQTIIFVGWATSVFCFAMFVWRLCREYYSIVPRWMWYVFACILPLDCIC